MKLFITGVFRTGTTLITQMLRQSDEISLTYDSLNFMRFGWQRYGRDGLSLAAAEKLGEDFDARLRQREILQGFDLERYKKEVRALEKINYAALYDIIMRMYVGNKNWGEKTVLAWREAAEVLEMFEDMFVIHVIRDPRDALVSWKKYTNAPYPDYLDIINNCHDSMRHALADREKHPDRYYVLRYEDVIQNPKQEVKKICEFTGVAFSEKMLDVEQFKKKVEAQGSWTTNSSFTSEMRGISKESVERWREQITREELFLCDYTLGDIMKKFNYQKSDTEWNITDAYKAFALLQQSPLACGGILNIIQNNEGVQRYPRNPLDTATWDLNTAGY